MKKERIVTGDIEQAGEIREMIEEAGGANFEFKVCGKKDVEEILKIIDAQEIKWDKFYSENNKLIIIAESSDLALKIFEMIQNDEKLKRETIINCSRRKS